jgi:hypothetical protein
MSRKNKQHTKQFKLDAVNYRKEHPDFTQVECAKNLGIGTKKRNSIFDSQNSYQMIMLH